MALDRYTVYADAKSSVLSRFYKISTESANLVFKDNEFQTVGADMLKGRCAKLMFAKGTRNKHKDYDRNARTDSYALIISDKQDGEPIR